MRFMAIVKPGKDYEAGRPPSPGLMAAMGKLNEESTRAGIFVTGGGLLPSSQGHKVRMAGGKITVTDGPFAEINDLEIELRPMMDPAECGAQAPQQKASAA